MGTERPPIIDSLTIRQANLPHWQFGGSVYFITFRSARGDLPETARALVLEHIRFDAGRRFDLSACVVMPDHVHLVIRPRESGDRTWYDLADILKGLKGASARRINQLLGTTGKVWQQESYDRIIRDEREYMETLNYVILNPVRTGLVATPEEYPFLVVEKV